jgi:hypothetical protein
MLTSLRQWFGKLFGLPTTVAQQVLAHQNSSPAAGSQSAVERVDADDGGDSLVPYDESLLEKARTQWQFGDWQSLAAIERDTLQNHPDRAKLALLVSAGHLQWGDASQAMQFMRLATDWGIEKKLLARILIAGTHNSLARAAAISGGQARAVKHFEAAIATGTPGADVRLLTQARIDAQISQLRLSGSKKWGEELPINAVSGLPQGTLPRDLPPGVRQAWVNGVWAELTKLDNAELADQANRSELALYAASGYQQLDDGEGLKRCTRLAVEWGCSKQRVNAMLAAGIRNTFGLTEVLAGQFESAAKNFTAALRIDHVEPKPQAIKARVRRQLKSLKNIDVEKTFDAIVQHIQ